MNFVINGFDRGQTVTVKATRQLGSPYVTVIGESDQARTQVVFGPAEAIALADALLAAAKYITAKVK